MIKPAYDEMTYIRCGRSGINLPAISLGLWHNFGDVDPESESRRMVLRAFELGITHFDLANNYGPPPGSAETNFGKILHSDLAAHRDELIISTKAGYHMWAGPYGEFGSRKYLLSSLDQSLKRMRLEYVDIFYSHRPDPETPMEETMGALAHAVHQGKALYAGISNYNADQTREAAAILADLGVPCLIHQPKYNMFDRWIESGLMDALESNGIGCIPFSPLAQGLLSAKYLRGIPDDSRAAKSHGFLQRGEVTRSRRRQIEKLTELATARDQSLAQMAISWILRLPGITSVLVGASTVAQIEENVGALARLTFDDDELDAIEQLLA